MKLKSGEIESFLRSRAKGVAVALVYGPDDGQVREVADRIAGAVVEDPKDPFRVAEIEPPMLRDEPGRLADEMAALSLTGGRRLVRLRGAGDAHTDAVDLALATKTGDSLLLLEAGGLEARSRLRSLVEGEKSRAVAIPCYVDEGAGLESVIRETLSRFAVRARPDAMGYLTNHLGGDRRVTRSEIEKLALFVGPGGEASLADVRAVVGDSAAMTQDEIAFAVADGDVDLTAKLLRRGFADGLSAVGICRAVLRHFHRLHRAAANIAGGDSLDGAMQKLRPPVFFAAKQAFAGQLRRWPVERLELALTRLSEAEVQCKSTGVPDESALSQALLGLAYGGGRGQPRATPRG